MVTRDPLAPWKPAFRILEEAHVRGFEITVAVDSRSSDNDKFAIGRVADNYIDFDNEDCWPEAALNRVLDASNRPWAFLVSDD